MLLNKAHGKMSLPTSVSTLERTPHLNTFTVINLEHFVFDK